MAGLINRLSITWSWTSRWLHGELENGFTWCNQPLKALLPRPGINSYRNSLEAGKLECPTQSGASSLNNEGNETTKLSCDQHGNVVGCLRGVQASSMHRHEVGFTFL